MGQKLEVVKREPLTKKQVIQLARILGGVTAIICDFGNIDFTRGRSIVKGGSTQGAWMWTKAGRKIEVTMGYEGTMVASLAKDADPEMPAPL
jgi:hypothetical protein